MLAPSTKDPHPLAGQIVTIRDGVTDPRGMVVAGVEARIEDWWDRAYGGSWMTAEGNPAALNYALRTGLGGFSVPIDDEVVYVKIDSLGHLVHVSEINPH